MMSSGGGGFGRGGRGAEVGAGAGAAVADAVGAAVARGAGLLLPPERERERRALRFGAGSAGALPRATTFGADAGFGTAGNVTAAALAGAFAASPSSPPMPATA